LSADAHPRNGAVALGAETDMLNANAGALVDLAEVLALADRDARSELEQALSLYERKGNIGHGRAHPITTG
jgi:hypothetical protein